MTWTNQIKNTTALTWADAIQTWASETSTWDELGETGWSTISK